MTCFTRITISLLLIVVQSDHLYAQNIPNVEIGQSKYYVVQGDTITLKCDVAASETVTSVSWNRRVLSSDTTITSTTNPAKFTGSTPTTPSLTIQSAELADAGDYTCHATNSAGRGSSDPSTLTVLAGGVLTAIISEATFSVNVGSSVTLGCSVVGSPAATSVFWIKIKDNNSFTIQSFTNPAKYTGSTVADPSLKISSANLDDAATYKCSASNTFGTVESTSAVLEVKGAIPGITIPQNSYTVNYGSSVTLTCVVTSDPIHSGVEWQKLVNNQYQTISVINSNGKYEGSSVTTPSLTVNNADLNDQGNYVCRATNSIGTAQSTQIFLNVLGNVPTVTIQQTRYSAVTGSTVTLVCTVTSSPAHTNVYWKKNINNVQTDITVVNSNKYSGSSLSTPSLTIFNVGNSDGGNYICYATNSVGIGQSTQTTLEVTGNSPTVRIAQASYSVNFGSSITMECIVTSDPVHNSVQWQKLVNNQYQNIVWSSTKYSGSSKSTPSLTINNAEQNDIGNYRCTATNSVGTGQSSQTYLSVTGNVPTVRIVQQTYIIVQGSFINMECTVTSSPFQTSVQWQKLVGNQYQNVDMSNSRYSGSTPFSPSLSITDAVTSDEGYYICRATNAFGTGQSSQTFLDVTGSVPSVSIQQSRYSIATGSDVTLVCTITSSPAHTNVYWKKIINNLQTDITVVNSNKYSGSSLSTPSLTIRSVDNSDSGNYVCYATNSLGTGQSTQTTLEVFGNIPTVRITQSSYSVVLGSSIVLECIVTSDPIHNTVQWQKLVNNQYQNIVWSSTKYSGSSPSTPSLTINSADLNDVGNYRCTATNSVGTGQSGQTNLAVTGNIPTVRITQSSYSVVLGSSIVLECIVTSDPIHNTVQWQKLVNNQYQNIVWSSTKYSGSSPSTPSLTINNADLNDVGNYRCTATNSVGTGQSGQTNLAVTGNIPTVRITQSSYSVVLGSSIVLECIVTSDPIHNTVQWQKLVNNQYQNIVWSSTKYSGSSRNTPSLTITNADLNDVGNYRCTATNSVGTGLSGQTYLSVIGNSPTVRIAQASYSVNFGSSITMECIVTSDPVHNSVQWQKLVNNQYQNIVMIGTKYSGSSPSTPSLTINSADLNDVGNYRCTATNSVGTGLSGQTYLDVTGSSPTVRIAQASYSVNSGSTITLQCIVTSDPLHSSVQWKKLVNNQYQNVVLNNRFTGSTPSTPSLTISSADLTDEGNYICTATNSFGIGQSSQTFLDVTGNAPTVRIAQASYSVNKGSTITLQCIVTSDPLHSSVQWKKLVNNQYQNVVLNNRFTGSTPSTPSLTISNADLSDGGSYICTATNSFGTGQSSQTSLIITGNAPFVRIAQNSYSVNKDSTVVLECIVTSDPLHTSVQWRKLVNNQYENVAMSNRYSGSTPSIPSLMITNADLSDEGYYTCSATNTFGTGQSSQTFLDVTGNVPTVRIVQASYSVIKGSSVTMECVVTSDPPHTSVQWRKLVNGQYQNIALTANLFSGSTPTTPSLTVLNSDVSDEGYYICTATNSFGTGQSSQTFLDVTGNVPAVRITQGSYSVVKGSSITMECIVTSDPAHTSVQWRRIVNNQYQNIVLPNSRYSGASASTPSLTISNSDMSDEGYYICTATNSFGTGQSSQTFLDVTGNVPTVRITEGSYSVIKGSSVTMECIVTSDPLHTSVQWRKIVNNQYQNIALSANKFTGSTPTNPSLTVLNADLNDEGYYVCTATNSFGTGQSSQTLLDVTGNVPTVRVVLPSYSVIKGSSITIECIVTSNPPHNIVQWRKMVNTQYENIVMSNNRYGGSSVSSPSLTISDAEMSDEGYYMCTATNSFGTGQSSQTFLDVTGNAPIVRIGQSIYSVIKGSTITMECIITSNPIHTSVQWKKVVNNQYVNIVLPDSRYSGSSINTPSLTVVTADVDDEGHYICTATNSFGTGQSSQTFLDVTGNVPAVRIVQPNYNVVKGLSVTIECVVTSDPSHTSVQWRKLVNSQYQNVELSNNRYSGSTVNTPSLTVTNADLSDEGYYICTATNSFGTGQSSQTFLDVTGNIPMVRIAQASYSVNYGLSVTLECIVTATPIQTSVQWRKLINNQYQNIEFSSDNRYEGSSVNTPSLTVKNVKMNDEGFYICTATNSFGTGQSSQTFLDVIGSVPVVTIAETQYTVRYGASRTLECQVASTPIHTSVEWKRTINGIQTTVLVTNTNKYSGSTVDTPSLTINNADNSDEGFYTCYATNDVGTGQSRLTYLDTVGEVPAVRVLSNRYTVTLGNAIVLECAVTANPIHTSVQWRRVVNGQTTNVETNSNKYSGSTVDTPSLTISTTTNSDEGYYTCTATNIAGTGSSQQTYLDVVGNIPSVSVSLPNYNSNIGATITLDCVVSADPIHTTVYWQKIDSNGVGTTISIDNVKYSGSSVNKPSLTISNTDFSDRGNYRCHATNSIGTGQSQVTILDVQGNIPMVRVPVNRYSVNIGGSITLECTVTASPSHTQVHWEKNANGVLSRLSLNIGKYLGSTVTTPSLTILNADNNDEGYYTCFATNSVGTGQSSITFLNVLGSIPVVSVSKLSDTVSYGGSITLTCTVTANPVHTNVYWQKIVNGVATTLTIIGNKYSGSSVNNPSLTISDADQTDEAFYVCYATNSVGTGNSQQTFLDVSGTVPVVTVESRTYSVNIAESVTLKCMVTSDPSHTSVTWLRVLNGVTSSINLISGLSKYSGSTVTTPSLTINNAVQADEGYYICQASNKVGTGQSSQTYLDVIGNVLTVVVAQPTYSVYKKSTVTLTCTVSGIPPATKISWQKVKNGQTTIINQDTDTNKYSGSTILIPSLTIKDADDNDSGSYTCLATNTAGVGQSQPTVLSITGNVPVATIPSSKYSVLVQGTISLQCSVSGDPPVTSVQWSRTFNGQTQNIAISGNNRYSGGTLNSPSLVITGADNSDEGFYICSATNIVGTGMSQQTFLNVTGALPEVTVFTNAYSVNAERTVTLECKVKANPVHTEVYWKHTYNGVTTDIKRDVNNQKYDGSSVNSPSLIIYNAQKSDEGIYVCYASNSVGTAHSAETRLDVVGNIPIVTVAKSSYTTIMGSSITLECTVMSNPTHTSVHWERNLNGQIVTILSSTNPQKYTGSTLLTPSLTINNAALSDRGSYSCHAENSIGKGHSGQTVLDVTGDLPTVTANIVPSVKVGSSVIINCVVTADPKETSIQWLKVSNSVATPLIITTASRYHGGTVATPSLTIDNVTDADRGMYICEATNRVGTGRSNQVYLDVVGDAPRLTYVTPTKIEVTEGQLIRATCVTTANPTARFTWYKDNSNQIFGTGDVLEITSSSRTDYGTYSCIAKNDYGDDRVNLAVNVNYKPEVYISKTTSMFSGVGGHSINIPCSYDAKPAVTRISWRKITATSTIILSTNGNKYAGSSLQQAGLTLYNLVSSDAAQYQCIATNSIGSGESEIVTLNIDTRSAPHDIRISPDKVDITVGTGFEATCIAVAEPSPTYAWYFSDKMIQTGPKLSIRDSVSTDDGLYTCVATNPLGTLQAVMDANIRHAPVSAVTQTEYSHSIGNPLTLKCSTRANPSATEWTWSKDGIALVNHLSDTYLVDMDSLQDLGTYTCVAKNLVGQSPVIRFNIKEKSKEASVITGASTSSSKLTEGELAAIIVGILLLITLTTVIVMCCFMKDCCRKQTRIPEKIVHEKMTYREPVDYTYQMAPPLDIAYEMAAPAVKSVEYIADPRSQYAQPQKYLTSGHYTPVIEYLSDYDDKARRQRSKRRSKKPKVVYEERIMENTIVQPPPSSVMNSVYGD